MKNNDAPVAAAPIPLLDLHALHAELRNELLAAIARVADSQQFILGEDVRRLEEELAAYSGVKHAVGCASGSDALFLALLALEIGPGDRVITSPFSFFATAGAISRAGATPVFADIDPVTFNIDPDRVRERLADSPKCKAIMPVHLYGGCADMDPLLEMAREHGCAVIEDGAQSIGAEYRGRKAQSLGDIGCISFFPTKNLGGFGDAGMLTTNNPGLARTLAALRVHGSERRYYHDRIGINSRLDTLQAAVLRVKLPYLDRWTAQRQRNAEQYRASLSGAALPIVLPAAAAYQSRHVFNQFVIRADGRDRLKAYLAEQGIGTEIYYPVPLHLQRCYRDLGYREGDLPESERAARETLALPVHPALRAAEIERICHAIRGFYS